MSILVHYKFHENLLDCSGNKFDGVGTGSPPYVNQIVGKALDLSGAEKYVTIDSSIAQAYSTFTVSIKIKLNTLPSVEGHLYQLTSLETDSIEIYIGIDNKIYALSTNDAGTTVLSSYSTALVVDTIYHISFSWDGTNQTLYVDNVQVDQDAQSGTITLSGTDFYLGKKADGLLAQYILESDVTDTLGNFDGINNGVTFVTGKIGNAGDFDGTDYIDVGSVISHSNVLSIFSWVYPRNITDFQTIISKVDASFANGWEMANSNGGRLRVTLRNSTVDLTVPAENAFTINTWYFVGFTYDGNLLSLYINNEFIISTTGTSALTSSAKLVIGARRDTFGEKINGLIDDVRIYTKIITEGERANIYNAGNGNETIVYNPEGFIDEFKFYDEEISELERNRNFNAGSGYDIWIEQTTYKKVLKDGFYLSSADTIAASFEAILGDRLGVVRALINFNDDVMIFHNGKIVLRGFIDNIIPAQNGRLTIRGLDYLAQLFLERYAVDKNFGIAFGDGSDRTRKYILDNLIASYCSVNQGTVFFADTGIIQLSTETIARKYDFTSVAEIFFTFAKEEGARVKLEPSVSLPLIISYDVKSAGASPIIMDWNERSNNTAGHNIRKFSFKTDARQIKNIFTVYGPASSKVAASVRDDDSIELYGEKVSNPIVDVNALTVPQCRERAQEEIEKWSTPIASGVVLAKDNADLQSGIIIKLSIDEYAYNETDFFITEATHFFKRSRVSLRLTNFVREAEEMFASLIKNIREHNFRDADPETNISQYISYEEQVTMIWTLTIKEVLASPIDNIIGSGMIGTAKIGSSEGAGTTTLYSDQVMVLTTVGKDALRDLITGDSVLELDGTNSHIAAGTNVGSTTHTEASVALDTEIGTRGQVDASPNVATSRKAIWTFTTTDTEIPAATVVKELGFFDASSSSTLVVVFNTNPITKVSGNDLIWEITMEIV